MRRANALENSGQLTRGCNSCVKAEQERADGSEQGYTEGIPYPHVDKLSER